jgi:hypothetical protein
MTSTRTNAKSTTRPAAVFFQFEWAMVQLLPDGEKWFETVVRPALEQRALRALQFFAEDADETVRAELHLLADWDKHERWARAKPEFVIPEGWTDQVSKQVRFALKLFMAQVDEEELLIRASLSLVPGRKVPGTPRLSRAKRKNRLATGRIMCDEELRHLPELRLFFAEAND